MLLRIIASVAVVGLLITGTVEAYDLPKIKIENKLPNDTKKQLFVSDWTSNKIFEERLKALFDENKNLSPASPERVSYDKNRVFIAFYKGYAYFLDKYSVQVESDKINGRSWTQRIFPIGQGISPKNSRATEQKFYFDGENFYNSLNKTSPVDALIDEDDKAFLKECFKVGYYFAFGEEL